MSFSKETIWTDKARVESLVQNKRLWAIQYLQKDKNNNAIEDELHNPEGKHQYELYKAQVQTS